MKMTKEPHHSVLNGNISAISDAKSQERSPNRQLHSFCTCSYTVAVTAIRVWCLVPKEWLPINELLSSSSSSSILYWLLHDGSDLAPFWTSTLMRPFETWDHVREARAVRQIFGAQQFRNVYRGSYIHLPPLVLAALEPVLDLVPNYQWQSFLLGILAHLLDLLIAIKLLQIGKYVLEELRDPWEDNLQPRVPESIRPPLEHIFALSHEKEINYTNELPLKKVVEDPVSDDNGAKDKNDNPQTETPLPKSSNSNQEEREPSSSLASSLFAMSDMPLLAAQVYYYSPITALASGLGSTQQSFQNLWLFLLLLSLEEGCRHPSSAPLAAFWLAVASYIELHYVVYLIPLSIFLHRRRQQKSSVHNKIYSLCLCYAFWFVCMQVLSVVLVGRSQFGATLYSSFGHVMTWKHLNPNLSVLWYLNMELFERYRTYFAVLVGGLPYILLLPVSLRLYRYPMVITAIFWMLWTMMRPTSTLVDANVACCLALLCPRSLARMRIPTTLIPAFAITVPISLYVVTLWLWLETGSGEANFTFFQCLAYCGFLSTIFLEFCGASVRRDKVLRLTEKSLIRSSCFHIIIIPPNNL